MKLNIKVDDFCYFKNNKTFYALNDSFLIKIKKQNIKIVYNKNNKIFIGKLISKDDFIKKLQDVIGENNYNFKIFNLLNKCTN